HRRARGESLADIACGFSPRYECHGDDLVVIDLAGLERLFGHPRTIGEELQRQAAACGVRVQVAIASTRTAAMILSRARPGLTVVEPGGEASAVALVPIGILSTIDEHFTAPAAMPALRRAQGEVSGRLESAVSLFRTWGLTTLGELAALPTADLAARLGARGLAWQALARGCDERPLVP